MSDLLFYKYYGSVIKRRTNYQFQCQFENKTVSKYFTLTQYGSWEKTRMAAEAYQENFSDENDLTTMIFAADEKEELRRYLIGFCEGDGCILVEKNGQVRVEVTQSQNSGIPEILSLLCRVYGAYIHGPYKQAIHRNTSKNQYEWQCKGMVTLPILKDWIQFGVLKQNQAKLVFDFMREHDTSNCQSLWLPLKTSKTLEQYYAIEIDDSVLTVQYIAGFFDAEGCIQCPSGAAIKICIAQKSSPKLLDSINNFFQNRGIITRDKELTFHGLNAEQVIREILPYLTVKKTQALIALEIRKLTTIRRFTAYSDEDLIKLEKLRIQLSALKRV